VEIIPSLFVSDNTISRRLVNMGKKLCLFVYYVKLIDNKQWMVEEAATLNGAMNNRTMKGSIRRRIRKQCRQICLLSSLVSSDVRLGLLRLVVVVFDFRYASDYAMPSNVFLLTIDSIRG
jgi:uncharacterized membrane protein YjgN (DUF898 family)